MENIFLPFSCRFYKTQAPDIRKLPLSGGIVSHSFRFGSHVGTLETVLSHKPAMALSQGLKFPEP
jgi:hypothetical protein